MLMDVLRPLTGVTVSPSIIIKKRITKKQKYNYTEYLLIFSSLPIIELPSLMDHQLTLHLTWPVSDKMPSHTVSLGEMLMAVLRLVCRCQLVLNYTEKK